MSWRIRGTYFESCNCDAICPCRRIDGVAGGRSTHGVCMGVLSWLIEEGAADGIDLAGLPVALACRYSDDEPGSPWTWILYLDAGGSVEQRDALEGIFTGRLGGDAERHFPWAWKASELVAVRPVSIDVDHTRQRQRLRIRDRVSVHIRDRFSGERDRHVRHPRPRPGRRGARHGPARGRRWPAGVQLQRRLRLWLEVRLRRVARVRALSPVCATRREVPSAHAVPPAAAMAGAAAGLCGHCCR